MVRLGTGNITARIRVPENIHTFLAANIFTSPESMTLTLGSNCSIYDALPIYLCQDLSCNYLVTQHSPKESSLLFTHFINDVMHNAYLSSSVLNLLDFRSVAIRL